VSTKPKEYPLEDHQDEGFDDPDAEGCETITLTYRDNDNEIIEEIEFDVSVEEGIRFHWWMVSQGMSSA
jgi:hypothetical protein